MTSLPTGSSRPSLASLVRGWKDDATGLEQRLKDLETISRTHRLRRVMVAFGFALGLVGWGFGAGVALVGGLLIVEHAVLARRGKAGLNVAFFTINGVVSCILGIAGCLDAVW